MRLASPFSTRCALPLQNGPGPSLPVKLSAHQICKHQRSGEKLVLEKTRLLAPEKLKFEQSGDVVRGEPGGQVVNSGAKRTRKKRGMI